MAPRHNVDDRITEATLDLLRVNGPRAVTVEAVAARSGIAKTTIYRRHRDRRDMLSAALTRVTAPEPLDPKADPAERFRWVITQAVMTVQDGIGFGGFAAMLTEEDPEFSSLFRRILRDQRGELESVIETAIDDGSMRDDMDGATLIDAVVGALIAERARTGDVADGWETRLFDLFWPTVRRGEADRDSR